MGSASCLHPKYVLGRLLLVVTEPTENQLRTEAEGRRKVSEGYVNFATQLNY